MVNKTNSKEESVPDTNDTIEAPKLSIKLKIKTKKQYKKRYNYYFPVWLRNRLISSGLQLVLS